MTRRFPWGATVLVALAVAAMLGLGVWQLHRLAWKEDLIARYTRAEADRRVYDWPSDQAVMPFAHVRITCESVVGMTAMSGRNAGQSPGWAHVATCTVPGGARAEVVLGWSSHPDAATWQGGAVSGVLSRYGGDPTVPVRVVADPPLAGLEANARPDPRDLPNNHFAYAVQWFLFAGVAVVIYAIALRRRLIEKG